jgi:RES domain-containing protein
LATLEVMVHTHFYSALKSYVCIPIDFDPSLLQSIAIDDLPDNWQTDPIPQSVKKAGDRWIKNQESVIWKVPSAIIPVEVNYLINPLHPDFGKIVIQYK